MRVLQETKVKRLRQRPRFGEANLRSVLNVAVAM